MGYRNLKRAVPLAAGMLCVACGTGQEGPARDVDPLLAQRPLRPDAAPSENFDLHHWKLTLPSGDEVSSAELNAGFQRSDSFHTDPASGGLVFRTPNIAGRTDSSQYSRTELREMLMPDGPADAPENNWTAAQGGTLGARLRVDAVSTSGAPAKLGRIVIGQIHGPRTEVVRLYFEKKPDEAKGRVYVATEQLQSGDSTFSGDIVGNAGGRGIALGETFDYRIELQQLELRITVLQRDEPAAVLVHSIDPQYDGLPLYFKAGVYNQNNTGDPSDAAQATFMALEASHPPR